MIVLILKKVLFFVGCLRQRYFSNKLDCLLFYLFVIMYVRVVVVSLLQRVLTLKAMAAFLSVLFFLKLKLFVFVIVFYIYNSLLIKVRFVFEVGRKLCVFFLWVSFLLEGIGFVVLVFLYEVSGIYIYFFIFRCSLLCLGMRK